MRDVKLIKKDSNYYVEDFGILVTHPNKDPFIAIEEWEHFEWLNTNAEPHRRFLNHVTPLEEIEEIVNKLKNEI